MILIDCSPLKSGGGCQLALNFINQLSKLNTSDGFVVLIPDVGPLSTVEERFDSLKFLVCPSSTVFKRVFFEYFKLPKIYKSYKVRTIYTFFGAGLIHPSSINTIVSVAYPAICYPDSPFWGYLPMAKKVKKILLKKVRINRLQKADTIVCETEVMRGRLSKAIGKPEEEIIVVKPSPTDFIEDRGFRFNADGLVNILIISSLSFHKNLWRLQELALLLDANGVKFKFILTESEQNFKKLNHTRSLSAQKLSHYFDFIGTVAPDKIGDLYEQADFLLSLSDLESYSNNYMEAWKSGVPLIVSDRDFSRHICQDSAVYLEPHDLQSGVQKLLGIIHSQEQREKLVIEGKKLLACLPVQEAKVRLILDVIDEFG